MNAGELMLRANVLPRLLMSSVLSVLILACLFLSFYPEVQREYLFQFVRVPAVPPAFADLNSVLSAFECVRKGVPDTAPCPPGFPFIYLKTLYLLLPLGLTTQHVLPVAIFIFAVFVASTVILLRYLTLKQSIYACVLFCAPTTLLAFERCNLDVLVYSLLAFAVVLLESRRWQVLALSTIVVAALLKIYPVAAIAAALGRLRLGLVIAASLACIVGFIIQIEQLIFISQNLPWSDWHSWGYPVAYMRLHHVLENYGFEWILPVWTQHVARLAAAILSAILAFYTLKGEPAPVVDIKGSAGFIASASVYCFCWFLGPNFDYRYIFLFLALPFLFNNTVRAIDPFVKIVLVCLPVMLWLSFFDHKLTPKLLQQALALAIFCSMLAILFVHLFQIARTVSRSGMGIGAIPEWGGTRHF
jgi:hypothetical protein